MSTKSKILYFLLNFFLVFSIAFSLAFSLPVRAFAALSCTVSTTCNSPDVVALRLYSTTNSHAELPSQNNYSQLVCCSGVTGLSNSCGGTSVVALRLSGDTNAHAEENTQSTAAYNGHNACISVPSGGSVSVGYQDNNCSGFDTTLVSLAKTPTNAHVGDASAYVRKVCVSAAGGGVINPCSNVSCGNGGGGNIHHQLSEQEKQAILKIADFNNDGRIDILDLSILLYYLDLGGYGHTVYDLNDDGAVDFSDISILFYYWSVF